MTHETWWREAVIYQVYLRSFADHDGDGVGDLPGLLGKLDYLRELGVDAVWLSPFHPSPLADFGYDVSDYTAVDPAYGTLGDFDVLVRAAHERGIRVLIDLIMNHTSAEHPWFVESSSDRTNPKRDWYIWADPRQSDEPPNNWLSSFERCGPAWTYQPRTRQCYLHSFTPGQPDLNWRNPEVRAAMREVWRFWLDRGVDGFRIDVAHRLMKDAELRDNPAELAHARRHTAHPTLRMRNLDLPETLQVLRELRGTLDEYGGKLALGEVPISDDGRLADYFGGDGMHTAFHIAFWEQPWRATAFRRTVDGLAARIRPGALPTYALATHDISRTASRYGGAARARVAAMMAFSLRGIPCVYYGEEIGMSDAPPPLALDVDGRDGQRTPMQWDATGRGFTTGTPWMPVAPDQAEVNVAVQSGDPDSLLTLYRRLISFRRASPALRTGDYRSLDAGDDVFAYLRSAPGERLLVALNFASRPATAVLPDLPAKGRADVSTGDRPAGSTVDLRPLRLEPGEGVIIRIEDRS
ncbi:alpha-amylase family glycosyl hydrolase [Nonomuraea zeae]|uniref:DUF3459 domain-containing protein n=1 Tax=Nonomuraea zeae TaxID=1642303 RepID=A0A5S4H439_9ACTN|nr:alpha-amylase family glycosyl hydrolase [Nonomuraea zeae]TMR39856.1 DUF3459 domain-containing protein [Nonomuraea zeae]